MKVKSAWSLQTLLPVLLTVTEQPLTVSLALEESRCGQSLCVKSQGCHLSMLETAAGGSWLVQLGLAFLASLSEAVTYLHPNTHECPRHLSDKTHKPIEVKITFWINNAHFVFTENSRRNFGPDENTPCYWFWQVGYRKTNDIKSKSKSQTCRFDALELC